MLIILIKLPEKVNTYQLLVVLIKVFLMQLLYS